MDSIRFQASSQPAMRPEVLNHRTSSPFTQNQIQFHIGSAYLKDFTDQGIEAFLDKHQTGSKKLSLDEVKTFIQRVASNAEAAKNVSFDLTDPQLGLLEDDGIAKRHLEGAFTLNVSDKAVLPEGQARTVRFVDVTQGSFDLKEKETEISSHQRAIRDIQTKLKDLRDKHGDTKDDQKEAREILGGGADERLTRNLERREQIGKDLAQIDKDAEAYRAELKTPELKPARKRELERILAAIPAEKKALTDERGKLEEAFSDTTGPLLQRYSLKELHQLNQTAASQSKEIKRLEDEIQTHLGKIKEVVDRDKAPAKTDAEPAKAADKPAEKSADKPADKPAGDAKPDEQPVTVGAGVDMTELRKLPPNMQAGKLASMTTEQQKQAVSQLKPEERQQVLAATEEYISKYSQTTSVRLQKQLESYKQLQTVLKAPIES